MEREDFMGKYSLKAWCILCMHNSIQWEIDHINLVLIQDSNTVALMGQPG